MFILGEARKMSTVRISLRELFRACEFGDVASVHKAVESGLNVKNAVNEYYFNWTPLHYACKYVHVACVLFT